MRKSDKGRRNEIRFLVMKVNLQMKKTLLCLVFMMLVIMMIVVSLQLLVVDEMIVMNDNFLW